MIIWNFRRGPRGSRTRSRSSGYSKTALRKEHERPYVVASSRNRWSAWPAASQSAGPSDGVERMAIVGCGSGGSVGRCPSCCRGPEVAADQRLGVCTWSERDGRYTVAARQCVFADPQLTLGPTERIVGVVSRRLSCQLVKPVTRIRVSQPLQVRSLRSDGLDEVVADLDRDGFLREWCAIGVPDRDGVEESPEPAVEFSCVQVESGDVFEHVMSVRKRIDGHGQPVVRGRDPEVEQRRPTADRARTMVWVGDAKIAGIVRVHVDPGSVGNEFPRLCIANRRRQYGRCDHVSELPDPCGLGGARRRDGHGGHPPSVGRPTGCGLVRRSASVRIATQAEVSRPPRRAVPSECRRPAGQSRRSRQDQRPGTPPVRPTSSAVPTPQTSRTCSRRLSFRSASVCRSTRTRAASERSGRNSAWM